MTTTATPRPPGLGSLDRITLTPANEHMLAVAASSMQGVDPWPARKMSEARQLLALGQLAGSKRMQVRELDLEQDLRATVWFDVPVAMTPDSTGALRIQQGAVVGIIYPRVILSIPLPGYALTSLVEPEAGAFYPNLGSSRGQRMCLGAQLPVGIPVVELALGAWSLLVMQTVMLDAGDSAGVMHMAAAEYWQANRDRMPLTREPLLRPDRLPGEPRCS